MLACTFLGLFVIAKIVNLKVASVHNIAESLSNFTCDTYVFEVEKRLYPYCRPLMENCVGIASTTKPTVNTYCTQLEMEKFLFKNCMLYTAYVVYSTDLVNSAHHEKVHI